MLSKLRNLFASSPSSPSAQSEISDITFGLVLDRYRHLRSSNPSLQTLSSSSSSGGGSGGMLNDIKIMEKAEDAEILNHYVGIMWEVKKKKPSGPVAQPVATCCRCTNVTF